MLGWIHEKLVIQESTPRGGRFYASNSTTIGNDSWDNAHTSDWSSMDERLGKELSTLVQRAQRTNGSSDG